LVKAIDEGLPPHALCGCIDGEHCEREEQFKRLAEELDYERRSVEMKQVSIDSLNGEVERKKDYAERMDALAEERLSEIERLDKQWREIVATVTAGNVALEAQRDAEAARYDAAMTTLGVVRQELERALLIVDAARNLDEHSHEGYATLVSYLIRLHEALTADRQPDPLPET